MDRGVGEGLIELTDGGVDGRDVFDLMLGGLTGQRVSNQLDYAAVEETYAVDHGWVDGD